MGAPHLLPRAPCAPTRVHARHSPSQTARLHLGIFLTMAAILLVLVVWFIGELQSAQGEMGEMKEVEKKLEGVTKGLEGTATKKKSKKTD